MGIRERKSRIRRIATLLVNQRRQRFVGRVMVHHGLEKWDDAKEMRLARIEAKDRLAVISE